MNQLFTIIQINPLAFIGGVIAVVGAIYAEAFGNKPVRPAPPAA